VAQPRTPHTRIGLDDDLWTGHEPGVDGGKR
jgi:hypothetical protein